MHRTAYLWASAACAGWLLVAIQAGAQLNKAYDTDYWQLKDLADDLNNAANASSDNRDFPALSTMAQRFSDRMDSLAKDLDGIGSVVQESDNRSGVANIKGSAVDAARQASDKAKALKAAADSQSDPTSQISDLRDALTTVSDDFRDVWKAHEAYRQKLDQDYTDASQKFRDSTQDFAIAVNDAWKRIGDAENLVKQKQDAFDASYKALAAAWSDAKAADDKVSSTITPTANFGDILAAWDNKTSKDQAIKTASDAVGAARKDWNDSEAGVQKAIDDYNKAQADYARLENDTASPLVKDCVQKNKLRIDFASEYKPISL
jgi:predicted  nucleic acid-binding Zn-ribbon protein